MSNPRSSDDHGDRKQPNGDSNLKHIRGTAAKDEKKQKSSDEEDEDDGSENKLAALNDMLKSKKFAIQREDEEDFEMFLKKLN